MSSQYVKYPSRQAGPFTSNQNLMDFELPDSSACYDLSKSFINIMCNVDVVDAAGAQVAGVQNVVPKFGNSLYAFNNVALIRNATMSARRAGKLEDLREIGLYRNTLMAYRKGKSGKESSEYGSLFNFFDVNSFKSSPARRLNYVGAVDSEAVEFPIQLPLSDIFEVGRLPEYHVSKWGQTRIHLEAYLSKLKFEHLSLAVVCDSGLADKKIITSVDALHINNVRPKYYDDLVGRKLVVLSMRTGKYFESKLNSVDNDTNKVIFRFATDVSDATAAADTFVILNSLGATSGVVGNGRTEITTNNTPDTLDDLGLWVGQRVRVCKNQEAASAVVAIEKIEFDANGDAVITLESALATPAFADADDVSVFPEFIGPLTETASFGDRCSVTFPSAEITLKVVSNPGPAPERLQYMTITTEQFTSGNAITNFERMFQLEPGCMNFYCMFPSADYDYSLDGPGITAARFRLDNHDLTDRDYELHKLLYNDRLSMLMLNSGYAVKDIRGTIYNSDELLQPFIKSARATVLGNPTPITPNEKLLQVNLTGTTGVTQMNIYKQVLRTV